MIAYSWSGYINLHWIFFISVNPSDFSPIQIEAFIMRHLLHSCKNLEGLHVNFYTVHTSVAPSSLLFLEKLQLLNSLASLRIFVEDSDGGNVAMEFFKAAPNLREIHVDAGFKIEHLLTIQNECPALLQKIVSC